jgi:hypothetical protein
MWLLAFVTDGDEALPGGNELQERVNGHTAATPHPAISIHAVLIVTPAGGAADNREHRRRPLQTTGRGYAASDEQPTGGGP